MIAAAFKGSIKYRAFVAVLAALAFAAFIAFVRQVELGLEVTGLGRAVPWGIYISQFVFFAGIAAAPIVTFIPLYFLRNEKFERVAAISQIVAIAAVVMSQLFIFLDMGKPELVLNVILHPTPNSPIFWDMVSLNGFLVLNIIVLWYAITGRTTQKPRRTRILAAALILWAIFMHTVTAFLLSSMHMNNLRGGVELAIKFFAGGFAAGAALLIFICALLEKVNDLKTDKSVIDTLSKVAAYAIAADIILRAFALTMYKEAVSRVGGVSFVLAVAGLAALNLSRNKSRTPVLACALIFAAVLLEKGFDVVLREFSVDAFGRATVYIPTASEILVCIGIYSIGVLIFTTVYKIYSANIEKENN